MVGEKKRYGLYLQSPFPKYRNAGNKWQATKRQPVKTKNIKERDGGQNLERWEHRGSKRRWREKKRHRLKIHKGGKTN